MADTSRRDMLKGIAALGAGTAIAHSATPAIAAKVQTARDRMDHHFAGLCNAMDELTREQGASGWHVMFGRNPLTGYVGAQMRAGRIAYEHVPGLKEPIAVERDVPIPGLSEKTITIQKDWA